MADIDPALELMLDQQSPKKTVRLIVGWSGTAADLAALGVEILSFIEGEDDSAIIQLPLSSVEKVANSAGADFIELCPGFEPELDWSRKVVKTPNKVVGVPPNQSFNGLTGKGVLIGIADSSIDVFHASLQTRDKKTRFHRLWDMNPKRTSRLDKLGPPPGFKSGLLYSETDINFVLNGPVANESKADSDRRRRLEGNLQMLRDNGPQGTGHGTGVTSVAAGTGAIGNQRTYGDYIGIAPEAKLVGVVMRRTEDWAMALRFLRSVLKGKPGVINLSSGVHIGPHLAIGGLERWVNQQIVAQNIPLVKSAGNDGEGKWHAQRKLARGETIALEVNMAASVVALSQSIPIEIWYGYGSTASPLLRATITTPDGRTYDIPRGGKCVAPPNVIAAKHRKHAHYPGMSVIILEPALKAGKWVVTLTGPSGERVQWHAWLRRRPRISDAITLGPRRLLSSATTATIPAAAPGIVVVSSFISKDASGNEIEGFTIAPSSARGPLPNDASKSMVTIAAPGQYVKTGAPPIKNKCSGPDNDCYLLGAGTSYAAPHVAGAIALMLEKNGNLTPPQISDLLVIHATTPDQPDPNSWGSGILNITDSLNAVKP